MTFVTEDITITVNKRLKYFSMIKVLLQEL